jgi:hypothetical protein
VQFRAFRKTWSLLALVGTFKFTAWYPERRRVA